MYKINQEILKNYRQQLISLIKKKVKPYLKPSEYKRNKDDDWDAPTNHPEQTGKPLKCCFLRRQVKPKFLYQTGKTVCGFTSNEIITNYGITLTAINFSHLCVEDLQVLAELELSELVKVEKPARS